MATNGPFMSASAWRIVVSPSVGFSSRFMKRSTKRSFAEPSLKKPGPDRSRNPVACASASKSWPGERVRTGIAANRFAGASSEGPTALVRPYALVAVIGADQEFQVVAVRPELAGQQVQELGVRRRVVVAEIIDGVDDARAEKPSPDPVHRRPGEIRVVGRGHPARQNLAPAGRRCHSGCLLSRNAAFTIWVVSGIASSRRSAISRMAP